MASSQRQGPDRDADVLDTDRSAPGDRFLAPDARPALTAVLDVLETDATKTPAEVVAETGFTERSVDRILRELAAAGVVREQRRRAKPSLYRRRESD